jgi:hypothetical protein
MRVYRYQSRGITSGLPVTWAIDTLRVLGRNLTSVTGQLLHGLSLFGGTALAKRDQKLTRAAI